MTFIVITGPQASGKGTQAEHIAQLLDIPHISIGDVLRHIAASGSQLGSEIKEYMDRGDLVPRELNDQVVKQVLDDNPNGLVLDGYPRNLRQAKFLDQHIQVDRVIVLRVPDKVCIERISGRRVCDKGHDYHIIYKPPKKQDKCDIDNLPLHMRDDDKPEAIKHRLEIYHASTEPVIEHYTKQGKVVEINGNKSISKVNKEIKKILR